MPDIRVKYEPGKYYAMADAAQHDMVVTIKCRSCRKTVHYWASDLVKVVGPDHPVARPPWRCSKCGEIEFLQVSREMRTAHKPMTGLVVRRPVKQVMRWLWKNERI
ncbi:hypothetical protein LOS78_14185 [Paracoccus sp. MA]|uniref:hypothetical protein n=1 Tax=Paracoccus sp. MA TaxID=2895796 RepID=UPI001E4FA1BD|nr:hypothetical protein [Paracoccus sp. MA]UFM64820.1 hypothetical protein LOS78_14185 [Paracoccus sp. MA]